MVSQWYPLDIGMLELHFFLCSASSCVLLQFSLGIESVQFQDRDKTRMYTQLLPSCPRTNRPSCSTLRDPMRQGMIFFGLFNIRNQMAFFSRVEWLTCMGQGGLSMHEIQELCPLSKQDLQSTPVPSVAAIYI